MNKRRIHNICFWVPTTSYAVVFLAQPPSPGERRKTILAKEKRIKKVTVA